MHYYSMLNEGFTKKYLTEADDSYMHNEMLEKAYNGSYYTIEGAGGNLDDWKAGYNELLAKEEIGHVDTWITFKGSDLNTWAKLTNDNAYPEDLTFLAFPLDVFCSRYSQIFLLK